MPLQATLPLSVVNVPNDYFSMADFEVTLHGRFWVTPEEWLCARWYSSTRTLKKGLFSIQTARFKRKTKIAQFRVFELNMEGPHSHRDVSPTVWSTCNYEHDLAKRKGRRSRFQRPSSYLAPQV